MTASHQELLRQQQAYYTEITQEYNLEKEQGRNKIIVIFCIKLRENTWKLVKMIFYVYMCMCVTDSVFHLCTKGFV